jgi:hypothetical protein
VEAHNEAREVHPGDMEVPMVAMKPHPVDMKACLGAMEAHRSNVEVPP